MIDLGPLKIEILVFKKRILVLQVIDLGPLKIEIFVFKKRILVL